jgi:hypothetical protein
MAVKVGSKPIEFEKGKAAISVGSLDRPPRVVDTLIKAVTLLSLLDLTASQPETDAVWRSIAFVRVNMDLVVSSTLALDATHDVEWYVIS